MKMRSMLFCSTILALSVVAIGCHKVNNLPPSKTLFEPGPGVGGPGPGVLLSSLPAQTPFGNSEIGFVGPAGMRIGFDTSGSGTFDSQPLIAPSRQQFRQGGIYRLKLTNIPGHEGEEYFPTLEVGPVTPRTEAYLDHCAIPVQLIPEDFGQVQSGNFVTKVIYLPDPDHQKLALAAIETLVSTRLAPGVDPIKEADRRGSILAILRIGNKILGDPVPGGDSVLAPGGVQQVGYFQNPGGPFQNAGGPGPMAAAGMSPTMVAGVNVPAYGMPISGTPIGLAGPPHIPLGIPAGLQRHSMRNKTKVHMPAPVKGLAIDVEQKPGYSYPKPPHRVSIVEEASHDHHGAFKQPFKDKFQWLRFNKKH
jgi:hypothetical protein